jgi:hypothetical protein
MCSDASNFRDVRLSETWYDRGQGELDFAIENVEMSVISMASGRSLSVPSVLGLFGRGNRFCRGVIVSSEDIDGFTSMHAAVYFSILNG